VLTFIAGVGIVAVLSASGDFLWYHFGIRHRMTAGLLHGALLLTVVGGVLGHASGRFLKGLPVGALAGLGGAMSYYAIIAITGGRTYGAAIPAAWIVLWVLLAVFDGRWIRRPRRPWRAVAARGTLAAIAGGLAFALVMTSLWGRPPAGGRNYFLQGLLWALAWAPGLGALIIERSRPLTSRSAGESAAGPNHSLRAASPTPEDSQKSISSSELLARRESGEPLPILDVRSEAEFAAGHIPGAVNVPFNQVSARLDEVPGEAGQDLIVYCGHGPRAYIAAVPLRHAGGRRVIYLRGHWSAWQSQGLPVEK
jgi:rhodanese-related sulfurtransferase